MKKESKDLRNEVPFTIEQIIAAMTALGMYNGKKSDAEHKAEALRLGGMNVYRMFLSNALLGFVETDTMLADSTGVSSEQMRAAHHQSNASAGAEDDPGKLLQFLRWRILRVGLPLREMAQRVEVGPLPLAAAHAVEGLQLLLKVCAEGQSPLKASPDEMTKDILAARESLTYSLANIDIMLRLLEQAEDLFRK